MNGRSQMLRFTSRFWFLFPPREQKALRLFWVVFSCCWLLVVWRVLLSGLGRCQDSKLESKPTKCNSAAMNGAVCLSPFPSSTDLVLNFQHLHAWKDQLIAFRKPCKKGFGSTFCVYFWMFQDSLYIAYKSGGFPRNSWTTRAQIHFLSGSSLTFNFPQLLGVGAFQKYHPGEMLFWKPSFLGSMLNFGS